MLAWSLIPLFVVGGLFPAEGSALPAKLRSLIVEPDSVLSGLGFVRQKRYVNLNQEYSLAHLGVTIGMKFADQRDPIKGGSVEITFKDVSKIIPTTNIKRVRLLFHFSNLENVFESEEGWHTTPWDISVDYEVDNPTTRKGELLLTRKFIGEKWHSVLSSETTDRIIPPFKLTVVGSLFQMMSISFTGSMSGTPVEAQLDQTQWNLAEARVKMGNKVFIGDVKYEKNSQGHQVMSKMADGAGDVYSSSFKFDGASLTSMEPILAVTHNTRQLYKVLFSLSDPTKLEIYNMDTKILHANITGIEDCDSDCFDSNPITLTVEAPKLFGKKCVLTAMFDVQNIDFKIFLYVDEIRYGGDLSVSIEIIEIKVKLSLYLGNLGTMDITASNSGMEYLGIKSQFNGKEIANAEITTNLFESGSGETTFKVLLKYLEHECTLNVEMKAYDKFYFNLNLDGVEYIVSAKISSKKGELMVRLGSYGQFDATFTVIESNEKVKIEVESRLLGQNFLHITFNHFIDIGEAVQVNQISARLQEYPELQLELIIPKRLSDLQRFGATVMFLSQVYGFDSKWSMKRNPPTIIIDLYAGEFGNFTANVPFSPTGEFVLTSKSQGTILTAEYSYSADPYVKLNVTYHSDKVGNGKVSIEQTSNFSFLIKFLPEQGLDLILKTDLEDHGSELTFSVEVTRGGEMYFKQINKQDMKFRKISNVKLHTIQELNPKSFVYQFICAQHHFFCTRVREETLLFEEKNGRFLFEYDLEHDSSPIHTVRINTQKEPWTLLVESPIVLGDGPRNIIDIEISGVQLEMCKNVINFWNDL